MGVRTQPRDEYLDGLSLVPLSLGSFTLTGHTPGNQPPSRIPALPGIMPLTWLAAGRCWEACVLDRFLPGWKLLLEPVRARPSGIQAYLDPKPIPISVPLAQPPQGSPHFREAMRLTGVSGGALLTVSAGCPRWPKTCPHQTRGWGQGAAFLLYPPSPVPRSLLGFAGLSGSCHQLLGCREDCFGHHLFGFLNRS